MSGPQGFQPRYAVPRTAQNMGLMMGDVSLQVSRQMLAHSPRMGPNSIVHDNGCGNGVVTQAIIETQDPANVTIHATDIGPDMCESTLKVASAHPDWATRVVAEVMPSEKLKFQENTFTHSYGSFLIFLAKEPPKVASEMFRTQKPISDGGIGYITTWYSMPHEAGILAAHAATRPPESRHLQSERRDWQNPAYVKRTMEEAGFGVEMSKLETTLSFEDTRKWCALAWGMLGAPMGGWTPTDEEKWDQAVETMTKTLEASEYFESNGRGGGIVKMIANLATLRKG